MNDNFVFLVSAQDTELEMYCDLLKKVGIIYEIGDEVSNAYFSTYGAAAPIFGKKLFVLKKDFQKAKDVLNLQIEKNIPVRKYPLWTRMVAMIFILGIAAIILISILINLKILK